jgi:hypothetical protein
MARVRDLSGNAPNSLDGITGFTDFTAGDPDRVRQTIPIVCSDTVNIAGGPVDGLIVTTAGAYKVSYDNGQVDSPFLAAGVLHPMRVIRVWATGSVATTGISGVVS